MHTRASAERGAIEPNKKRERARHANKEATGSRMTPDAQPRPDSRRVNEPESGKRTHSPLRTRLGRVANAGAAVMEMVEGNERRRAPWRAVLGLALLALGAVAATPARAQTETEIWSATLTVATIPASLGEGFFKDMVGAVSLDAGSLSDDDFTYPTTNGTDTIRSSGYTNFGGDFTP